MSWETIQLGDFLTLKRGYDLPTSQREEALRDIHVELEDQNAEAVTLAATIKKNFEELGV